MAQLSKDSFDVGDGFLNTAQAVSLLLERVGPECATEVVSLKEVAGRILAADVISDMQVPAHDNSAVDGYAVYFEDMNPDADTNLPVVGRVAAGHVLDAPMEKGTAVRIFTGAPIPEGVGGKPDTIMMQEDCTLSDDGLSVTMMAGIKKGANYRSAGEDIDLNQVVLKAGMRLGAQEVGVAASIGITEFSVYKKLRVAVLSSGDEIYDPGQKREAGGLYDSNRYMLLAALRGMGFDVTDLGILPDLQDVIEAELTKAVGAHDVIVTSGGMSVGEEDHMKLAVQALGDMNFWRLAIKPGRPVGLGRISANGKTVPLVGLPGNPVAAITTLLVVGRPLLVSLSGETYTPPHYYAVNVGFSHKKKSGPREYIRARLEMGVDGAMQAVRHGKPGAAMLTSMVGADGFLELPEDMTQMNEGDKVQFLSFKEVL